ncbi:hypothetical protein TARUN_6391 [Trichoderma arundinaceum]|uniref:Uncharacterized protein n=1 Tax=Trichoderma arundinaceum TaxID=490622 RepID=A0A395NIF2_TRIAR|nr:hypothetical protein TARUN_6391 [Trichoderma arundinaceum]
MARTRSQARVQTHGRAAASQPRYYENECDSSDGSVPAEQDSDGEYTPRATSRHTRSAAAGHEDETGIPQTPNLIQVEEQNLTPPRGPLRVINHSDSSSPHQGTVVSQSSESTDLDQTVVYHDFSREGIIPPERPSDQRFFFEDELRLGPPSFMDLTRLEFFQTFPHDPAATLCRRHFLQLAQSWFMRRQGHTENMIYDLNQEFPCSGVGSLLNFSRDREILGQAVWDEPWRRMDHVEFMANLQQHLQWAEVGLEEQRRSAIASTGIPPKCDLENCGVLSCGYCLAMMNSEVNLYQAIREARAQTWHGAWQDRDAPAFEEHQRRRIDALGLVDTRQNGQRERRKIDMRPAYVSVGGLHFIVDVCNGETMIRFQ